MGPVAATLSPGGPVGPSDAGLSLEDLWDLKLLGYPPPPIMEKLRYMAVPKNHLDTRNT